MQTLKCTTPKCKNTFRGFKGKEDTCPKCLKELINPKQTEYNTIIDALNLIDAQANGEYETDDMYKAEKQREKAYTKVADFVSKYAKR